MKHLILIKHSDWSHRYSRRSTLLSRRNSRSLQAPQPDPISRRLYSTQEMAYVLDKKENGLQHGYQR